MSDDRRTKILLVTDNELIAYAMTSALIDRARVTFVMTPGEALVRVSRGERFDLALSSLSVRTSLSLHAAIARRNPRLGGRMLIFDGKNARHVIGMVAELDVGERAYERAIAGSGRGCGFPM